MTADTLIIHKKQKKSSLSEWHVRVTYNSDNWKKYCELNYVFKGTPQSLEKRIWKHYETNYEDYGKAEAVEVELIPSVY